jgi:hypothetical protein
MLYSLHCRNFKEKYYSTYFLKLPGCICVLNTVLKCYNNVLLFIFVYIFFFTTEHDMTNLVICMSVSYDIKVYKCLNNNFFML